MKRILTMAVALMALSCCKDNADIISPEDLANDPMKIAKTTITTKGDQLKDTVTSFELAKVYRESETAGKSNFIAISSGKMVYEVFMLSFDFDSIDTMEVGDNLNISRFMFSFVLSSDSNATTWKYGGNVRLADKGDDYVILHFDNLLCSCSFGDYLIDGYLNCPIIENLEAEEE
jgi:hypothetical protein